MKKQKFDKKLFLKTRKISNLTKQREIVGGKTLTCNPCLISDMDTCTTVKPTQAIRCGHTIGNGQNPDGTPCTH